MGNIRTDIIAALITTILLGLIGYILGFYKNKEVIQLILPALILLIGLFLIIRFFRPLMRVIIVWGAKNELKQDNSDQQAQKFKEKLALLVDAPNGSKLLETSGLVGWYPNFDKCSSRLEQLLAAGSNVKLLTYIAKSDIGKGTNFYKAM